MDDKYRFEDFGFFCEPGNEDPMTPVFENKTMHIPGRAGLWDFGSEIKGKSFAFPLKIMDMFYDEMQIKYNDFATFLFDAYGQPREIKVIRDYEPDKYYMVKLASQIVPALSLREGTVILPFVANDPDKKLHVMTNEIHWNSTTATYDDSWSMSTVFVEDELITSPQTVETYVNGKALIPTILITGSGNDVTLSVNGKSFSLKNFNNSTLEIEGTNYTVYKNGQESLSEMDGDFLTLLPKINQVKITGSNMNFKLSIGFRDLYI